MNYTLEQLKEINQIAVIISKYFCKRANQINFNEGSMDTADVLSDWAIEFYNDTKDIDWSFNSLPIYFVNLFDYEVCITAFAKHKMETFKAR